MDEQKQELVRRMADGDEAAFEAIYHFYSGRLYGMAYFILRSRGESEDAVQEAFVQCWLRRGTLREAARFESWLYRILTRCAWRIGGRHSRRPELSLEEMMESETGAGPLERAQGAQNEQDGLTGMGTDALERLLRQEEMRQVRRALNGLSYKQRTVVYLYYYQEMGTRQIAQTLGIFEGTVKSRLHAARRLMAQALREAEQDGTARRQRLPQNGTGAVKQECSPQGDTEAMRQERSPQNGTEATADGASTQKTFSSPRTQEVTP